MPNREGSEGIGSNTPALRASLVISPEKVCNATHDSFLLLWCELGVNGQCQNFRS
jgi:hypothetical protein